MYVTACVQSGDKTNRQEPDKNKEHIGACCMDQAIDNVVAADAHAVYLIVERKSQFAQRARTPYKGMKSKFAQHMQIIQMNA